MQGEFNFNGAAARPVPMAAMGGGRGRSRYGARRNAYSGAAMAGGMALWRPGLASVDSEIALDGPDLRARARDLARNHAFARQAVRTSRLGVIGGTLRYSCRPDHRFLGIDQDEAIRWGQEWERIWESYASGLAFHIDAGRRLNFTHLMALAHDSDFVDGEFLIGVEWDQRRRWKTCFQVIDVDRLSTPDGVNESRWLRSGVELGQFNEPIAYHVRAGHPGDALAQDMRALEWDRMQRETAWGRPVCLHGFDSTRGGQTRGVSEMASVIATMKMGQEYTETALQSAILQASYAAVIESEANYRDALEAIGMSASATEVTAGTIEDLAAKQLETAVAWHEQLNLTFGGAKVSKLVPGEKLHMVNGGTGASSLAEFQSHASRSYAAGMGVDPIGVSQDYSSVNYSSAKMSQATTFRNYGSKRDRIAYTAGLPMVAAALEEAVHSGAFSLPKGLHPSDFYAAKDALVRGVFLAQGAPNLDPVKEAQALEARLRLGIDTLQDAAASEGRDYRDVIDQRAREKREMIDAGLAFDEFAPLPEPGAAPEMEGAGDG